MFDYLLLIALYRFYYYLWVRYFFDTIRIQIIQIESQVSRRVEIPHQLERPENCCTYLSKANTMEMILQQPNKLKMQLHPEISCIHSRYK